MGTLLPEEQATKETYDKLASAWVGSHNTDAFWKDEMQTFHKYLKQGAILEIGAGGGRDAKELVELGYSYVGTDVSSGLLDIARKEMPDQEFYEQSVHDLHFPEREKFDGFWASAVLLHVPKSRIDEALQQIKKVVKPGGVGFISLQNGDGEKSRINELHGQQLERWFAYWRKDEFTEVLERNAYKVLEYINHPFEGKDKWHCFFVQC